jgi:hypothetical protein
MSITLLAMMVTLDGIQHHNKTILGCTYAPRGMHHNKTILGCTYAPRGIYVVEYYILFLRLLIVKSSRLVG